MDKEIRWFAVPVGVQLSNVGSEVHRAIKWKTKVMSRKKRFLCKIYRIS